MQEKIRSAITDSVLKTSDGTKYKTVDQIELLVLLKTVLNPTEQPAAADAHDEYKASIAMCFDFRGRLVNAVEKLRVRANKAKGCGIIVNNDTIVLVTMANVE